MSPTPGRRTLRSSVSLTGAGRYSSRSRASSLPTASVTRLEVCALSLIARRRSSGSAISEYTGIMREADLVAAVAALVGAAQRHRHHRDHGRVGQLALVVEVLVERPADDGEEQVVERRAAHGGANGLEFRERQPDGLEHAVRRDVAAEAGLRRQPREQRAQVARQQRAQLRQQVRSRGWRGCPPRRRRGRRGGARCRARTSPARAAARRRAATRRE